MEPPKIVEIEQTTVACDGGGALGHPRVFLHLDDQRRIDCPYCGIRFQLKDAVAGGDE